MVTLDGIMATGLGIGALVSLNESEEGPGLALLATAGLFVASALRGNSAANECRAAYGEYNLAYQRARRQAPVDEPQAPPTPRPAVKRQPPPDVEPELPVVADPVAEVAPEYASPRPPVNKPAPPIDDDEWSAFWKELP